MAKSSHNKTEKRSEKNYSIAATLSPSGKKSLHVLQLFNPGKILSHHFEVVSDVVLMTWHMRAQAVYLYIL